MKRASEPEANLLDSEKSQHQAHRPAKQQKKSVFKIRLFDISLIRDQHGDEEFYRNRFFAWRRINHRDDPGQSLADKTNSWRTFVRLENEYKMDFLLKKPNLNARRGSETHRTTDRSSVGDPDTTSGSRSRERYRGHQPQGSHDVPRYLRSAGSRATERERGDSFASSDGVSTELDHPYDPQSTPPATDDLRESQSTEVGLNAKTIERLWRWKSAHRAQIEELHQHCSDLMTRCETLEARCGEYDDNLAVVRTSTAQTSALKAEFESSLQQSREEIHELQKREKARDLSHSRVLWVVEDAGSTLGALRGEFEARLAALESVKDQSFDVLQRLYAESQLHTVELGRLRSQIEDLQRQMKRHQ